MGATPSKGDSLADGDEIYIHGPEEEEEMVELHEGTPLSRAEAEAMAGIQQLGALEETEAPPVKVSAKGRGRGRKRRARTMSVHAPVDPEREDDVDELQPGSELLAPAIEEDTVTTEEMDIPQVVTVTWKIASPYGGEEEETRHYFNDIVVPDDYYIPPPRPKKKTRVVNRRMHQRPWAIKEVKALLDGVQKCGEGHWSAIKKLSFAKSDYRTAVDLKDKWRNLVKASKLPRQKPKPEKNGNKQRWAAIPPPVLKRVKELVAEQEANAVASPRKKGRPKKVAV
eukprot:TRINITY_DN22302_c0_g1_i1.p1 TRINITY_DN22302_c0_g1~~TRINITY_DN22302_c0_g1_i1.p1  ORF type:complete len:283 (-),score=84.40 TRINITY_DN22302_c0_g1_i1:724-1572(-)